MIYKHNSNHSNGFINDKKNNKLTNHKQFVAQQVVHSLGQLINHANNLNFNKYNRLILGILFSNKRFDLMCNVKKCVLGHPKMKNPSFIYVSTEQKMKKPHKGLRFYPIS